MCYGDISYHTPKIDSSNLNIFAELSSLGEINSSNIAVKSFKFRLVAVYASNIAAERFPFFRRLAPFLDDTKRLVLMGDWNAILDPKIDKVGRGVRRAGRCDSSLVGFVTRHGLVDRFRLDHPGREMWTWLDSSPYAKIGSYLDRVLARRADIDFVSCPTFHLIAWTDHKLVRVSVRLAKRPSLAGYWKFNTSLLEIRDFRDRLESLIQRALVGAVTGIGGGFLRNIGLETSPPNTVNSSA